MTPADLEKRARVALENSGYLEQRQIDLLAPYIAAFGQACAAEAYRDAANEGDCRREHGGTWEHFNLYLKAKAAALTPKESK